MPGAWRQAAAGLDRDLPANSRALVLPGQLFSYYNWGGAVDPILQRTADALAGRSAPVPPRVPDSLPQRGAQPLARLGPVGEGGRAIRRRTAARGHARHLICAYTPR